MSQPIIELIEEEIINRLENIQLKNGYAFTVASVELVNRDLNSYPEPGPLAIIVDLTEEAENEEMSCPGNPPAVAYDASFMVHGYAQPVDRDDTLSNLNAGITRHQMQAAIHTALVTPTAGDWAQWEGNALTTSLQSKTKFEGPGTDGVTVGMLITYRTDENDPTVKR